MAASGRDARDNMMADIFGSDDEDEEEDQQRPHRNKVALSDGKDKGEEHRQRTAQEPGSRGQDASSEEGEVRDEEGEGGWVEDEREHGVDDEREDGVEDEREDEVEGEGERDERDGDGPEGDAAADAQGGREAAEDDDEWEEGAEQEEDGQPVAAQAAGDELDDEIGDGEDGGEREHGVEGDHHRRLLKKTGLESDEDDESEGGADEEAALAATGAPAAERVEEEEEGRGAAPVEDEIEMSEEEEGRGSRKRFGPPLEVLAPVDVVRPDPSQVYMMRSANILGLEAQEFDSESYKAEVPTTDEHGRQRVRLDDNIARWRWVVGPGGEPKRESNAHFVRWDDGTLQLIIGGEVLNVSKLSMEAERAHLFVRHQGLGLLEGQGRLLQKMQFRPSSLNSKSHQLLTRFMDQKYKKVKKVQHIANASNTQREFAALEKAEEQRIAAQEMLRAKQARARQRFEGAGGPAERRQQQGDHGRRMEEDEEARQRQYEEELEREAEGAKRIQEAKRAVAPAQAKGSSKQAKKQSRKPNKKPQSESEEEYEADEEEEEWEESPPQKRSKRSREDDEEEQEQEEDDELEDEAEEPSSPPERRGGKRRVVVSDDEDED